MYLGFKHDNLVKVARLLFLGVAFDHFESEQRYSGLDVPLTKCSMCPIAKQHAMVTISKSMIHPVAKLCQSGVFNPSDDLQFLNEACVRIGLVTTTSLSSNGSTWYPFNKMFPYL